ncbi:MAG: exodeoxyribonuclease VII large subunit [Anaerovibrio sp.]|nr:exodeoxyribonuclease VII large subunit [Anaerovibrio sp.]
MSRVVTVSELTKYLANLIAGDNALKNIAVTGEISNFKKYSSGHCYFNLKDKGALIPCVMFRSNAQRMRFQPQDGMQVIAAGAVNVYTDGGRYQLYVSNMAADGIGDLAAAFEQLKEKLAGEGLFDAAHKKNLPVYPKKIGIVTSPSGAVLRDIYRVAKRRFPAVQLVLKPVQVQGEGSSEQIAAAIDFFSRQYPVDVLIVGRGGGSIEDLWAFNEEIVVRAIFRSRIPVISAVGHETDFTLADFAADKRAATPSQAAELAVRDIREISGQLDSMKLRMRNSLRRRLETRAARLQGLLQRTVMSQPKSMLAERHQRLDMLRERLRQGAGRQLKERRQRIAHLTDKLELVNPLGILRRGYGLVQKKDGAVVSSINSLAADEIIRVQVSDGAFAARVTSIEEV